MGGGIAFRLVQFCASPSEAGMPPYKEPYGKYRIYISPQINQPEESLIDVSAF